MAFDKLQFTKNWNNPDDFPTVELSEEKVRADMQLLHDEVKNYLNDTLLPALERLGVGAILQTASAEMKYLRVTAEGVVQYSADGETWTAVHSGASGTGGGVAVDKTLTVAGAAADAKAVGDALKELKEPIGSISSALDTINGEVV